MDRAVALREAHFAAASGSEAEGRLCNACAPLRDAGSDPIAAAAAAVKFLAALNEGEGASTFELIECGGIEALDAFFSGRDLPQGDAWSAAVAARLSAFVRAASANLPENRRRARSTIVRRARGDRIDAHASERRKLERFRRVARRIERRGG